MPLVKCCGTVPKPYQTPSFSTELWNFRCKLSNPEEHNQLHSRSWISDGQRIFWILLYLKSHRNATSKYWWFVYAILFLKLILKIFLFQQSKPCLIVIFSIAPIRRKKNRIGGYGYLFLEFSRSFQHPQPPFVHRHPYLFSFRFYCTVRWHRVQSMELFWSWHSVRWPSVQSDVLFTARVTAKG